VQEPNTVEVVVAVTFRTHVESATHRLPSPPTTIERMFVKRAAVLAPSTSPDVPAAPAIKVWTLAVVTE
jgi:hypothetical protein